MMVDFVESRGTVCLVQARGRINALTADMFEAHARHSFPSTGHDILMDTSDVTYLSSAGLRAILRLWRELKEKDRNLHICAPKPYIRQVFEIIGFDQFIPIEENVAAAWAAVENRTKS